MKAKQKKGYANSIQYVGKRLRVEFPNVYARVESGEISVHAAAVLVGYRKEVFTVPLEPAGLVQALQRRYGPNEWAEIQRLMATQSPVRRKQQNRLRP